MPGGNTKLAMAAGIPCPHDVQREQIACALLRFPVKIDSYGLVEGAQQCCRG